MAALYANQQLIEKVASFGVPATSQIFVRDLMAAARHDDRPDQMFNFALARDSACAPGAVQAFGSADTKTWLAQRVRRYAPGPIDRDIVGYLVVGGRSVGFAFGKPEFFLNASHFPDDPDAMRVTTAHELYHAAQSIFRERAGILPIFDFVPEQYEKLSGHQRRCYAAARYFSDLITEGMATYVGDPALLADTSDYARTEKIRFTSAIRGLRNEKQLLELAIRALTTGGEIDYQSAYEAGFYGEQPLYYLGYAMAKTIATADGDAALAKMITDPGAGLIVRYAALATGKPDSPRPGPRPYAGRRWQVVDARPRTSPHHPSRRRL